MKSNRILNLLFLACAIIAGILWKFNSKGTLTVPLKNFAVEDTTVIDKIFLADRKGNSALLERVRSDYWKVNGKYRARQDAINTLLYTMLNVEVKSPVGKNMYNNTMKQIAANGIKCETYSKGTLLKTYYVGFPTMDNLGTFMYMEGSSEPFITFIPGFNGFLSSRYFAGEMEWRDRGVFSYIPSLIQSVKIVNNYHPDRSFQLMKGTDSTYHVTLLKLQTELKPIDLFKIRDYLNFFQSVNYEHIDRSGNKIMHDSIMATSPFCSIEITATNAPLGSAALYRMPINSQSRQTADDKGKPYPFDLEKFYLRLPADTTWYVCQYYHFDNVVKNPLNFRPGPDVTAPQDR